MYRAFSRAVEDLYASGEMTLAGGGKRPDKDFDDALFDDAARKVYEDGGFDLSMLSEPQARALIDETLRVIGTAVDSALPHEVPETLRYALENNAFVFSGFKTFHTLREVGLSMITEKGDIKPFGEFLRDVQQINARYNHNYLYAEYNHALAASQMAAKWNDFEQDGDRYNLQYRTAGDDKVREEHAILDGTTLPPSDPFWDMFLPPNGWNCRCTAVQVRNNKYPASDPELAMMRGMNCTEGAKKAIFRYNPGKSLQIFPPKHPYYKAPKEVKEVITRLSEEIRTPEQAVRFILEQEGRREWFERGFSSLIKTTRRGVNGFTDMNGLIAMTPERLDRILSGLTRLRQGGEVSENEADALATFWHEITHNRNKPGNMLLSKTQTRFMELANEFVARKTLPEFYESFGGKMQHPEFMDNRVSTGYNTMVRNYCKVIELTGANAGKVLETVREFLFTQPYTKQKDGLVEALIKGGAKKTDGKKLTKGTVGKMITECLKEKYFDISDLIE